MSTTVDVLLSAIETVNTVSTNKWSKTAGSAVAATYFDGYLTNDNAMDVIAVLLTQLEIAQREPDRCSNLGMLPSNASVGVWKPE
jgi:hypothetical protein